MWLVCCSWAIVKCLSPRGRSSLAAVLLALQCGAAVAADTAGEQSAQPATTPPKSLDSQPAASGADGTPYTLCYFASNRPIFIRLLLTHKGGPIVDGWNEFLAEQFAQLDADKDGVLKGKEVTAARGLVKSLASIGFLDSDQFDASHRSLLPTTPTYTLAQFEKRLRKLGARTVRVSPASPATNTFFGDASSSPQQQTYTLWETLDSDENGRLSREELRGGFERLARRDFNEDEQISGSELTRSVQGEVESISPPLGEGKHTGLILGDSAEGEPLAHAILENYDRRPQLPVKERRLTRANCKLAEETFRAADGNSDGEIDVVELSSWLKNPTPQYVFRVECSPEAMTIAPKLRRLQPSLDKRDKGINSLETPLDNSSLTLKVSLPPKQTIRERYSQAFRNADQDNNSYLSKEDASNMQINANLYLVLDADHDDQLFLDELTRGLLPFWKLSQRQIDIRSPRTAPNLLEQLGEANSPIAASQLGKFADRLATFDLDGDGELALSELPAPLEITIGPRRLLTGDENMRDFSPQARLNPQESLAGPDWFTKMDFNRDGKLSATEFLGSERRFMELDTNGDHSISPAEAAKIQATPGPSAVKPAKGKKPPPAATPQTTSTP